MTYQLVIECINYYGNPSPKRIDFVKRYLKKSLGNVDSVQMFESEISQDLIVPQILIYYNEGNPESIIPNVDSILSGIGLTMVRALVLKVITRAAEGAIIGGAVGSLSTSKKKEVLLYGMVGALFGTAIGGLIKKGIPVLVAVKECEKWSFHST